MPGSNRTSFQERLCLHFYDGEDELPRHFTPPEISRLMRLRDLDREVLRSPMRPDSDRVQWLRAKYKIGDRQAYYDLADLKIAVGTFSVNNKEYERRELSEGLRRMMRIAEEKGDLAAYARLAKEYKAVNRLDKDDPAPVDTTMIPLSARPTMDAKALNEKWTDERLAQLKKEAEKLWGKRLAEDVDYEDVPPASPADPFDRSHLDIEKNNPPIPNNDDRDR